MADTHRHARHLQVLRATAADMTGVWTTGRTHRVLFVVTDESRR